MNEYPGVSPLTPEEIREATEGFYRRLLQVNWGTMSERERKKLRRLNPLIHHALKGLFG